MKTNITATSLESWISGARARIIQIRAELQTMFGNTAASDKLVEELEFLEFIVIDHDKLCLEQTAPEERFHLLDDIQRSVQNRATGCLNGNDSVSHQACVAALGHFSVLRDQLRNGS